MLLVLKYIFSKLVQFENALLPIAVIVSGIVIDLSDEQPSNVYVFMLVKEVGILIVFKDVQLLKAYFPMLVTESGIVIDFSVEQS